MQKDPYDWAKERIGYLIEKIDLIKNDNQIVSPGRIWSIKKLLALDYYIASTHAIFKIMDNTRVQETHCSKMDKARVQRFRDRMNNLLNMASFNFYGKGKYTQQSQDSVM